MDLNSGGGETPCEYKNKYHNYKILTKRTNTKYMINK